MNPGAERRRAEALLHEALALDSRRRADFLRDLRHEDEAAFHELESLLAFAGEARGFLEPPDDGTARSAPTHTADDPLVGAAVGPYRIVRRVGAGGMGAVYLAERDDAQFDQRVAVKLVHAGLAGGDVAARFRVERQALASLEHPNIARLLDGGVTESGLPYLLMEYVDGVALDRYCDERRLSIRRRLELFRAACDAVHYAHQNLVVHRDLKPGNILVSAAGRLTLPMGK